MSDAHDFKKYGRPLRRHGVNSWVDFLEKVVGITPAQLRVVQGVITGVSHRELGKKIGLKEKSVKCHLTRIYKRLGIGTRAQLQAYCFQLITEFDDELNQGDTHESNSNTEI